MASKTGADNSGTSPLMQIIGKLVCFVTGKHKRGKLILSEPRFDARLEFYYKLNVFRCPRCNGNERRYKLKPQSPAKQTREGEAE
jgi:hypothetical protein